MIMNNMLYRQTILIVDDTIENIDIIDNILKNDYNIKFAISGKMCIEIARRFQPDLILLDIMMPEMDGFETCRILKEDPITQHIPIIFVTIKDQDFDEAKGFEYGAVDYITKPISPIVVKARVNTQLALYNQKNELSKQVKEKTKELNNTRLEIIRKLGLAAEYKDNETGTHVIRMSQYCYHIAKAYGFNQEQLELILNVSPMHDVGKLGIPDSILRKPGKLDNEEFDIIKTHCEIGARIIGEHPSEILSMSRIVAFQHHEKWNGKGYPQGLEGNQINIYARIVAVSDVFDALTSKRPYKDAWDIERAINLVKEETGQHFDPDVVKAFLTALPDIIKVKEKYQENNLSK